MMTTEAAQPRDIAVSLFNQGASAAEVWTTLVSSGMDPAAAEELIKELLEIHQAQIQRAREEEEQRGSGFCKKCYADSTGLSSGNTSTTNGIGSTFYGNARSCDTCGSVVRVLWTVVAYFPIWPLGTYRYQPIRGGEQSSRQTRFVTRLTTTSREQVLTHVGVAVALLALFVVVTYAFKR